MLAQLSGVNKQNHNQPFMGSWLLRVHEDLKPCVVEENDLIETWRNGIDAQDTFSKGCRNKLMCNKALALKQGNSETGNNGSEFYYLRSLCFYILHHLVHYLILSQSNTCDDFDNCWMHAFVREKRICRIPSGFDAL